MTSDELYRAEMTTCAAGADAADDLLLLRTFEPVLRFTRGELFLPMPVEDYLEKCSLWRTDLSHGRGGGGTAKRLCPRGGLTLARLAEISTAEGQELSLRFVERGLGRANYARGAGT